MLGLRSIKILLCTNKAIIELSCYEQHEFGLRKELLIFICLVNKIEYYIFICMLV